MDILGCIRACFCGYTYTCFHDGCLFRFVTGPPDLQDASGNIGKVPKIHITNDMTPQLTHLVVYRALSATVCLFIEGEEDRHYITLAH
jgi:hypothetical protein